MRIGFPIMLTVSVAVHVSIATGIALSYYHGEAAPAVASSKEAAPPETTMVLRSEKSPEILPQAAKVSPAVSSIPAPTLAAVPAFSSPVVEKALSPAPSPASLALEANPNAHVHALPPDAVLSPTPAPRLNGADGVVFILDISGSMYEPYNGSTRLALARECLSRHILALKDGTPFAITLYALRATTSGPLVAANNATREAAVRFIMRDVDCGGGTNLPAGFAAAQQLHAGALVLVTDGDLNMSTNNLAIKTAAILGTRDHCAGLSIIGIAPRIDAGADRLLQKLADYEGGTYAAVQAEDNPQLMTSAANVIKPASATP